MINEHIFERVIVPAPRVTMPMVPLRGRPVRSRREQTTKPISQPPPSLDEGS